MAERVVIVRAGTHLVSLPFDHIEEILGPDRITPVQDLPEDVVPEDFSGATPDGHPGESCPQHWVFSRGTWLPVNILLPGTGVSGSSQIVVVRWGDVGKAFAVDQVIGIETHSEMAVFPERASPYTDVPIAGVRFRKEGPVLELDLSRLISLNLEN